MSDVPHRKLLPIKQDGDVPGGGSKRYGKSDIKRVVEGQKGNSFSIEDIEVQESGSYITSTPRKMVVDNALFDKKQNSFQCRINHGFVMWMSVLHPHIHFHYFFSDREAFVQGFQLTEICCHICGASQNYYQDFPIESGRVFDDPEFYSPTFYHSGISTLIDGFLETHMFPCMPNEGEGKIWRGIVKEQFDKGELEIYCPPDRVKPEMYDFRNRSINSPS
jgi:hypothetical protein